MKNFLNKFNTKHIGVIKFHGAISKSSAENFRKGFLKLEKDAKNLEAVAFIIDSTGGSAVSSNAISNLMTSFCKVKGLKLMTFAEEFALSGGYWLLCMGDEVYAYKSSKIGSIGAVSTVMDFKNFLDKRQIDRIHITSKKNDDSPDMSQQLDLFSNKDETALNLLKLNIEDCHKNFKEHVLKFRKNKFTNDLTKLDKILNADFFIGQDAKDLGLIDDFGDFRTVIKNKYPGLKIKDYTPNHNLILNEAVKLGTNSNYFSNFTNLVFKH